MVIAWRPPCNAQAPSETRLRTPAMPDARSTGKDCRFPAAAGPTLGRVSSQDDQRQRCTRKFLGAGSISRGNVARVSKARARLARHGTQAKAGGHVNYPTLRLNTAVPPRGVGELGGAPGNAVERRFSILTISMQVGPSTQPRRAISSGKGSSRDRPPASPAQDCQGGEPH